jgi:hypothetical protein
LYRAAVHPETSDTLSRRSLYAVVNSHTAIVVETNRQIVAASSADHEQRRLDWRKAVDAVHSICPVQFERDSSSLIFSTNSF